MSGIMRCQRLLRWIAIATFGGLVWAGLSAAQPPRPVEDAPPPAAASAPAEDPAGADEEEPSSLWKDLDLPGLLWQDNAWYLWLILVGTG